MTGIGTSLEPGEVTIARARVCAQYLARRLTCTPIDRQLYGELQRFLDRLGFRACDALETLAEQADPQLRQRLHFLLDIGSPLVEES